MASDLLHLARAGKEYGTCPPDELAARLAAGEVLATDHYWRPGMKAWALVAALLAPRPPLPFVRPVDKASNFLDDLFSRESKVKGLQLLWDQLAASPRDGLVTEAAISAIAQQVGYDVRKRCQDELKQWYRQALASYLADRLFLPQEKVNLDNLARTFGFDAVTTLALHRAEFESYYAVGAMTCLMRAGTPEEKAQQLEVLAREVPLPSAVVADVKLRAFKTYFGDLYKQNVVREDDENLLDPSVGRELRRMANIHGLDLADALPELSAQLTQSIQLWQLYKAPLTPISSDRELGNEPCYWDRHVELYQNKRITVRRSYGGFGSSIKIFGSLRYRVGSYDVGRQTEDQVVQVDAGRLLFLAQRAVFDGQLKNMNFKYAKVVDIVSYTNALVVSRDSGPDLIFMFTEGPAEAGVILRRLVRQVKG
ncbi:MAG: hypothetical protein K9M83_07255 [Opitutales bacterium]|nr:hypothetical protein [Opitutales bacterium]